MTETARQPSSGLNQQQKPTGPEGQLKSSDLLAISCRQDTASQGEFQPGPATAGLETQGVSASSDASHALSQFRSSQPSSQHQPPTGSPVSGPPGGRPSTASSVNDSTARLALRQPFRVSDAFYKPRVVQFGSMPPREEPACKANVEPSWQSGGSMATAHRSSLQPWNSSPVLSDRPHSAAPSTLPASTTLTAPQQLLPAYPPSGTAPPAMTHGHPSHVLSASPPSPMHAAATRKMTPDLLHPGRFGATVPGVSQLQEPLPLVLGQGQHMPAAPNSMQAQALPSTSDGRMGSDSERASSFLPGTTRTGKRRRRHPVAEVKGNWTPEEDRLLIEQVKQHGPGSWSKLLPMFPGRIGKQLRERWNHELRPDINKQGWNAEEELALVAAHRTSGNCWADIAKSLPGRTQNGVKNHWHATMRKVQRAPAGAAPQSPLQVYLHELRGKQADQQPATGAALSDHDSDDAPQNSSDSSGAAARDDTQDDLADNGQGIERKFADLYEDPEAELGDASVEDYTQHVLSGVQGRQDLGMLLRQQDSGVTPKTPVEALEASTRSRGFASASHGTSSPSTSHEGRDSHLLALPDAAGTSTKRSLPEPAYEDAPRAKRPVGRPPGSGKNSRKEDLRHPEHSVAAAGTLLLLQTAAAEESDGTPAAQTQARTPRVRRPPAWQRDMTPGTSAPPASEAAPSTGLRGSSPGPAGLLSSVTTLAMAADGLRSLGITQAGEGDIALLEAALGSGAFPELSAMLGSLDLPSNLASRWRGPKGSQKRPSWVLLNLLRLVAEVPQLWALQEALRDTLPLGQAAGASRR